MKTYGVTHQGLVRENNEDHYTIRVYQEGGGLLAVADGMGGHAAGEVAAQVALSVLEGLNPAPGQTRVDLIEPVSRAHEAVLRRSAQDMTLRGMGTTLTVAVVLDDIVHWVHVGDSRLYLFRRGELIRITHDHTLPGLLLRKGEITAEEARLHPLKNMLMRCVGCEGFEPETGSFRVEGGDTLILTTDGLHDAVSEEALISILGSQPSLEGRLDELVLAALSAGGRDNITAVGAEI